MENVVPCKLFKTINQLTKIMVDTTIFSSLGIQDSILKALSDEGYTTPTPIQAEAIPHILNQKDILGCAQTGTGKTAAFAIPIIQLLSKSPVNTKRRKIRTLILTPTRELAIQINESFKAYGKYDDIVTTVIFGGVGQKPQTDTLQRGVDVLIATPGRLLDLIGQGFIHLDSVEIFVLDEADRMLDMGFVNDVKKLITMIPKKRQSLFFSATMPPVIVKLADTILFQPVKVEVTPVSSTAETIQQFIYFVDKGNKPELLKHILQNKDIKSALVFTRTKHGADKVVKFLEKNRVTAEAIHGNKAQNARQRALANFKNNTTRVLVATDIAARGIDIDSLEYVINFDISNESETYVHRIGRTGRAGANGTAYSFCNFEEKAYLKDIEKLIGLKIPSIEDHPFPMKDFFVEEKPKQQQRPPRSERQQPADKPNKPTKNWNRRR
jgi:ATP-dependent RNA helicase RhlE